MTINIKTLWDEQADESWMQVIGGASVFPDFSNINENDIAPAPENIFRAFELTPYNEAKVLILGQDPYPTQGDADGLAFSCANRAIPRSLRNIYKRACANGFSVNWEREHTLVSWAKQGVLLLNTALTTKIGKPKEHSKQWEKFADAAIKALSEKEQGVVFLLWGDDAKKYEKIISETGKQHKILDCSHPSPLSCSKTNKPFMEMEHFKQANEFLQEQGTGPIDWSLE